MREHDFLEAFNALKLVIEVEVHSSLRGFLREQGLISSWPHHLTMARLVARALRLGRPALIQTGVPTGEERGRYRLSYLAPALMWKGPVILVAPTSVQQRLLQVEIPQLQQWMQTDKIVETHVDEARRSHRSPDANFQGLLLTTPGSWLADKLHGHQCFFGGVTTIIDGADDLEGWARDTLTACIQPRDWDELMNARFEATDAIRDARVQLTKTIFQHPPNPYECYLVEKSEQGILRNLYETLVKEGDISTAPLADLPISWRKFWQRWLESTQLMWASIARTQGQFSLYCGPVEVANDLSKVWAQQPVVLIGGALDLDPQASVYRQQMGLDRLQARNLENLLCLKFSPDKQSELIQLYVPDKLPMPNTPQFQDALMQQVRSLILECGLAPVYGSGSEKPIVILVGDVPLKAQVGTILASEFGSRVQVEKTSVDDTGILITGWEFWRQHQSVLPSPKLLIVATLPIPSLEDPLVAGRVAYYKKLRKDWFRLYLLPVALRELQRAIAPVRESLGVVALLDSRVNHRSYGQQVLAALEPWARINYPDASWLTRDF